MTMDKQHKLVDIMGHWEVQDLYGNCIVSGDTREEALEAYDETKYDLDDEDED